MNRLAAALLLAVVSGSAWAVPPTDQQVDTALQTIADATKGIDDRAAANKARMEAAEKALGELTLAEATLAQIDKIAGSGFLNVDAVRTALCPRLDVLAKDTGPDGARAAELGLSCITRPKVQQGDNAEAVMAPYFKSVAERVAAGLKHPGTGALVKSGKGEAFFRWTSSLPAATVKDAGLMDLIDPLITAEVPATLTRSFRGFISTLNTDKDGMVFDKATRDRVRGKIIAALEANIAKLGTPGDDDKPAQGLLKSMQGTLALASGPWGRGELLNHEAPKVSFTWSNSKQPIHSFADLKGKVVVVDFWATWCGPCIASFPNVRKLQERYNGYDVVILGVTSLQGFHIKRSLAEGNKSERIDCKGSRSQEQELMPSFIKDMDMTWTIAFTEQEVFNPDFGVSGIPHVAIIDPSGKVRYNGLHPGSDLNEKFHKIDDLLKEAGLKVPEPVASAEK